MSKPGDISHGRRNGAHSFDGRGHPSLQSRYEAQKIVFGPIVFQCVRLAWKWGLLEALDDSRRGGLTADEVGQTCRTGKYATDVLLESCLSAGIVVRDEGKRFRLSRSGECVVRDPLTQVNFDFVNDVCYAGMMRLEQCLREERPLGLQSIGDGASLYEAFPALSDTVQSSWLAFDHFYSDSAFAEAREVVFAQRPARMLDVGANTGRWALECLRHDAELQIALVDLPGPLEAARATLGGAFGDRVSTHAMDVRSPGSTFPPGFDAVWMSQFLVCLPLEQAECVLRRAARSLVDDGALYVLETFWDNQAHEIAAYCVINTSPYFTAIATGNSKMYSFAEVEGVGERAGLVLDGVWEGLGVSHTLMRFRRGT